MAAESNVGARIFLIGKDAALAGLKEIQGAVAKLNAEVAAGAKASATAAAGDDEQTAAILRMNAAMDAYKANLAETTVATDALARVGKVAFYAIAAAAAAWGYESVKWAQSYQTALTQLETQAGLTARAVRSIGKAAETNAKNLGISPTAYVQTIYHPASAGFGVRESEGITTQAVRLAQIGGSNAETTTNALTGVMRAYNLKGRSTLHTAALLNAIIGAGNMHASTLVASLASGVAASAKTFGVSLPSLGSALAFMTDRGVPASQAGTHLRMTLSLLGAPSAEAATLLKQAGLTTSKILSSTNAMSQMLQAAGVTSSQLGRALRTNKGGGGIYNAMELLHRTLTKAGLTAQMQGAMISRSFGGGRMGTTIEMLYNSLPTLKKKADKIEKTGTSSRFMKDWTKEQATLDFQLKKLGVTIETIGTKFGTKLIPPLTKAVELFTDMLKWLDKNKAVAYALGGVISAVLAPAIGLYLYRALFKSGGAIKTVIQGYGNLLKGNDAEQIALKKTAEQLTLTSEETENLARKNGILGGSAETAAGKIALETKAEETNVGAADADAAASARLGGASATAAGKIAVEDEAAAGGGLKGMIGGLASSVMKGGMYAMGGVIAGTLISQGQGGTVHKGQTIAQGLESEGSDIARGAGIGAGIGSIIPGVGTVVGGAVGGLIGAGYGVRSTIASDAKSAWDDLFGGGHTTAVPKGSPIIVQNHVYIDGKEVEKSTTRRIKKKAALTG